MKNEFDDWFDRAVLERRGAARDYTLNDRAEVGGGDALDRVLHEKMFPDDIAERSFLDWLQGDLRDEQHEQDAAERAHAEWLEKYRHDHPREADEHSPDHDLDR